MKNEWQILWEQKMREMMPKHSFDGSLKILGIEHYRERIFNSNSHGEMFHLMDYMYLADSLDGQDTEWFKYWFDEVVGFAEENWKRPESIFQHIPKVLEISFKGID